MLDIGTRNQHFIPLHSQIDVYWTWVLIMPN